MAKLVLVIAKTGTGKTTSMRNLNKKECSVISCSGKELPFKTDMVPYIPTGNDKYAKVINAIQKATTPIVVIDDANYLLTFEEMARANELGYTKFSQMAVNMFSVFKAIMDKPGDQIFYVMAHAADTEDDSLRFKTTGKMLSEKVVLEGLTNIVVSTDLVDDEFVFKVKTDGTGIKTPIGMFSDPTVPNDLRELDVKIREYYK